MVVKTKRDEIFMNNKLIPGGIYNIGANEDDTDFWIFTNGTEDTFLFHKTDCYTQNKNLSKKEEVINEIIKNINEHKIKPNSYYFLIFKHKNIDYVKSYIYGYLGQIPDKVLKELKLIADKVKY